MNLENAWAIKALQEFEERCIRELLNGRVVSEETARSLWEKSSWHKTLHKMIAEYQNPLPINAIEKRIGELYTPLTENEMVGANEIFPLRPLLQDEVEEPPRKNEKDAQWLRDYDRYNDETNYPAEL